jgi:hypothetical protein
MTVENFVAAIFTDQRWQWFDRRHYFASYEDARIGAVLATWTPDYENFALNEDDMNRLLGAKRDGKIDRAFVVMAKFNGTRMEYCSLRDAERYYNEVLRHQPTKNGRYGRFWALRSYLLSDEDKRW